MRLARAMKRNAEKSAAVGELRAVKDYARIKKTVRHATTREVVMCEKARKETETASMIIMDVAVNRVFGFGKKNALRLRKKMNSHMECIKRKYVTVAEIEDIIRDELRMDLTKESEVREWDMLSRVQYETVCEMTAVFLLALHDEFGIGQKRAARAYRMLEGLGNDISTGKVTLDEMRAERDTSSKPWTRRKAS